MINNDKFMPSGLKMPLKLKIIQDNCIRKKCKNFVHNSEKKLCYEHCISGSICIDKSCGKRSSFNYTGEARSLYCNDHKLDGMVNVKHKTCEYPKCTKRPGYNYIDNSKPIYCSAHKSENMVDVRHKHCIHQNCRKIPCYNHFGENKGIYCRDHKLDDMVDIVHDTCKHKDCSVRPSYNFPGEVKPVYCVSHKLSDMIDVVSNICQFPTCRKQPFYGYYNGVAIYCNDHKMEGMVDVKHQTCKHPRCNKRPCYNYIGKSTGEYCRDHKVINMVDVVHSTCQNINCRKRPSYGNLVENKPVFCNEHKVDGMVDVLNLKCVYPGCETRALYGYLFETKTHCGKHRNLNQFRYNNPVCMYNECTSRSICTNDGSSYPLRCEYHKLHDDINIIERQCSSCHLIYFIPVDKEICSDCYGYNDVRYAKEDKIFQLLQSNNIILESRDTIIKDDVTRCSRYRPDFVIDRGTYKIIIEVDENQHMSYSDDCEKIRMRQIYFDFGGINLVFIRYNPDVYKDLYDQVKLTKNSTREKVLLDLIKCFNNVESIDEQIRIYYLFYDGYTGFPEKSNIDPYIV